MTSIVHTHGQDSFQTIKYVWSWKKTHKSKELGSILQFNTVPLPNGLIGISRA